MSRQVTLLFLLLLLCPFFAFAQTNITGQIFDEGTKEALPFVFVKVESLALGTVSEGDGKFQIKIPPKYDELQVVFSYVGYEDLKISVKDLRAKNGKPIYMKTASNLLSEVVVKPRKLMSAKALLRKVISKIPKNYSNVPSIVNGYYRESLKENGVYIRFADAVCSHHAAPYTNKKYKWKHYENPNNLFNGSLSALVNFAGGDLHRSHFHHKTLKEDQVKIIDSRSSLNYSKRDMNANIMGGPLSLFGRDRVKFRESFLGRKAYKRFDYLVDEVQDENGEWLYVLAFHTKTTKAQLEALEDNKRNIKQWALANKNKLLKGKIYIDKNTFAVLRYECSVPNHLKEYFCGFTTMNNKHFDYKLDVRYKKKGGRYYLDYLRHEDEFIYKDTVENVVTPYAAISEFWVEDIQTEQVEKFKKKENFSNVNSNQLYDYALEYDSLFWVDYARKNELAKIETDIRKDMELEKTMEVQFRDKHRRDENMTAPIAKKEKHSFKIHGQIYQDDYAWLKDTKSPRHNKFVMDYLRVENDYTDNYFIPLRKKQRYIFSELSLMVQKNITSLPFKENGYLYFSKYSEEEEYPIYFRKKISEQAREEILLNVNEMAKGKDYYSAGGITVSPNNNIMAFYENTTGMDGAVLKFKDLEANVFLMDSLENIGSVTWIDDSSFYYAILEEKTFRAYQIKKHILFTKQETDELIFEEKNPAFSVSISKSKSKEFIFLSTSSSTSSETWYLRTDSPNTDFQLVRPREVEHLYSVAHFEDKFYIFTNKNALNYKVALADTANVAEKKWQDFIPHRKEVLLGSFVLFDNYYVMDEKVNVQNRLKVVNRSTGDSHYINFKEDIYNVNIGYNPDTDSDSLQFSYSSFRTPSTIYRYHMGDKGRRKVRQAPRPFTGTYKNIKVKREWVTAHDGKQIPLTIIYDKWKGDGKKSEHGRAFITSYGSYGAGQYPFYSPELFALLNRGFVYAIAHVRGGDDLGMEWYEDGKMLNKKNTFHDFISCTEFLIEKGYAQKGEITAQGGSAGGLLMGAIANMRPELFKTIILDVPFVDVINTMLDETLPLTSGEFEEWGNPKKKKYFDYIKSYSPYDNVKTQAYPNMLFFTSLNDTRVGYWEPAKMVAKLRETKTDDNLVLLKTNLFGGHGGGSGRYAYFRDMAYQLALIFELYE